MCTHMLTLTHNNVHTYRYTQTNMYSDTNINMHTQTYTPT